MSIQETELKPVAEIGSGLVRRFDFPDGKTRIFQISTFCPDIIGPGPTNVYLIENEALILVDVGIPTNMAKAFFYQWRNQAIPKEVEDLAPDHSERELIEGMDLIGRSLSDINQLVISHGHPDHFLMAHSILERTSASVSAHILESPQICNPWGILNMWISRQRQMFATGMPAPWSGSQSVREHLYRGLDLDSLGLSIKVDSPIFGDGPLKVGGMEINGVQVRHLPGHSPGSVGLIVGHEGGEKALICGDVLLNPITPHPDDLLVYLQTLEQLAAYEDIQLVLPAHGRKIVDLKARVGALSEHHRNRLRLTYEICSESRSVWDVATTKGYFDTYVNPAKFNFLAGMEALVHMELLSMVDGLERCHTRDGVHYFISCAKDFDEIYGRIRDLVTDNKYSAIMRY
ncbi:MAG: MBL fold metallo-hydrolase [Desulfomonile tiedjei]|uniref:MBL fold metallo-hydrolase n=1 Tax=Desulfomonile tiedjei TaxID=2358 RepID=A0A9D6Z5H7_9BACT|nr:MBL fold metallo-hydrolase [Desulfomonile tiedjei]